MNLPFAEPIILRQRVKGSPDSFGNDTWTTADTTVRGAFNPGTSAELVQGQDLLTVQPSIYLPAGAVVASIDAVMVRGQEFEVDGAPNQWQSPLTGWPAGVEVKLRRVTG